MEGEYLEFTLPDSIDKDLAIADAYASQIMEKNMSLMNVKEDQTNETNVGSDEMMLPTYGYGSREMHVAVEPPRFMNQTFSLAQPLGSSAYSEAERVRNSFRTGSHWSVKKLPKSIKPGEVSRLRKEHTSSNLSSSSKKPNSDWKNPLLERSEKYISTRFEKPDKLRKLAVDEENYQIEGFARRPFVTPSGLNPHPAAGFINPDFGPGGAAQWDSLARKEEDHTFIAGPFYKSVPATATTVPKENAKRWVKELYEQLAIDWSNLLFSVKLTDQEIVVKFPASQTLPPEGALVKYMLRLAGHGNPQKWGLKKRGDRWCVIENPMQNSIADNSSSGVISKSEFLLTFAFYLPWVRHGLRNVTKAAGNAARLKVHQKRAETAREQSKYDKAFELEQEEQKRTPLSSGRARITADVSNDVHGFHRNRNAGPKISFKNVVNRARDSMVSLATDGSA